MVSSFPIQFAIEEIRCAVKCIVLICISGNELLTLIKSQSLSFYTRNVNQKSQTREKTDTSVNEMVARDRLTSLGRKKAYRKIKVTKIDRQLANEQKKGKMVGNFNHWQHITIWIQGKNRMRNKIKDALFAQNVFKSWLTTTRRHPLHVNIAGKLKEAFVKYLL